MEKQSWHAGAAEGELSKEEIMSILTSSPTQRGEVLKQELVQRSILHLVATDQPWWTDHGADLLQSLSKAIRGHAYESYDWELRSSLLQTWGQIPALRNSQLMHSWLDVRWSELGKLLSLGLPEGWYKIAITMLLSTPLDIPPQDAVSIVSYHPDLFEAVLHQLMRAPATRRAAMSFFATLAAHGYPRKVQLLEIMLLAATISKETMETLFATARLEPRNVVNLLENHCQLILSKFELPPTLVNFIRQYLVNFDVGYLNADRTKELLQRLQQRNEKPALHLPADLQAYVQGWCSIADFIGQHEMSKHWLRDASSSIRGMPALEPGMQIKLTDMLIPRLIELISSEMDLCRMMDNLGQVLMGGGMGAMGPGLLLLEQITARVGVLYEQERPLVRLVPYIKVVLEEAYYLPSPEKEEFIHRCLPGLLRSSDTGALNMLKANAALWPLKVQIEWKAFLTRYGLATIAETVRETEQPNLTLQHNSIQPIASLVETRENDYPVAVVNKQTISFEQFRKMYYIKTLYRQYDSYVQQRTVNRDRMRTRMKESSRQVNDEQFQQEALDDLINDLLIREGIAELVKQNSSLSLNFDPNRLLSPLFGDFKEFCGLRYASLLSSYQLNDADVVAVLRIFLQQELFDLYLQNQRKSLNSWLKERRQRATVAVNIRWRE
jgi:hypothetical protein